MRKLWIVLFLLAFTTVEAQDFIDKAQINGSFQVDGQFYQPDDALGITDSIIGGRKLGLNGFGNITYTLGKFSAGIRYEAFLTPLAGFDPLQEGNGFPYLWASYQTDFVGVTVGNFYEQFGNGLILRSYEEWTLGYDNSINGMRVILRPSAGITIKGVYGTQRYFWQKYENGNRGIVRGLDAEVDLNQTIKGWESAAVRVLVGASGVSKYQKDNDPLYNLPENVGAWAGRVNLSAGKFNFATEYAYKINDPSAVNNFIYREGQAVLSSLSYSQPGLGVVLQLKRVDNFSYKSDRRVNGNAVDINFIPPINRTHSYSLAARYPYATQPNGEMGLQFQLNYKIPKGSALGGKYGTGIAINFSQVNDIVRNPVNDTTLVNTSGTLGYTSDFFKVSDSVFFRDFNIEIEKKINNKWKAVFQYMNLHYDIATIEGHAGEPAVKAHIGVLDLTYKFTSRKSLRMELQGLFTEQDEGDWAAAMLEYAIAPRWFFNVADQYNYGHPDADKRNHYYTVSMGYLKESTRVALTYGRQSEGVVCVGGVCRQVPASSGLTITVSTNF
ncbi:MAG: hypothetical protein H0S84_10810 [Bacteroidales bacterium]|jgi:hypothetical protein|nr:hypothetical protein [Bacteroidales bacterium]